MKYFNLSELVKSATAERLAIDNTPPRAAQRMLTILVEQLLDPIRRRYGAPIIITSGYRCPALNTAVGGVANSHHIVGCAADIVAPLLSPQGGKNQTAPFLSSPLGGSEGGCGDQTQYLFHLIVQMQREGAIRFTQLIAEKDYRWLHISYVPGMLRNQVIDVNINFDVNENDNCLPEGKRCEATLVQTSEMQVSLRFLSESSQVSMTKSLTSSLTLSLKKSTCMYRAWCMHVLFGVQGCNLSNWLTPSAPLTFRSSLYEQMDRFS